LADVLASFLLSAKEVSATSKAGKVETLEGQIRVWLGRLSDAAIDSDALRQLRAALLIFLATHESTFVQRRSHSRVRDGHGRLLAENVYLVDPLTIVGCVDTRDWSRQADILWDPAVLSVDLRRAGLVEAADRISAAVLERLGEPLGESPDENLWHFYSALAALAGAQDASDNAEWTDQDRSRAQAWLSAGQSHARRLGSQRLLITTGLMGTGKTTFTEALESHLGLERISSEDVARELYPAGGKGQPGHNRLDPAQSDRIYGELIRRMRDWLARGVSVVVDAGFLHARHRQWALEAARSVGVEPMFIECRLSKTETIARLDRRYKKNRTRPGSRPELYEEQARLFEPPDEIPSQSVQVLNMGQPVPKLVEIIREWLL
jgi:predicted kinase